MILQFLIAWLATRISRRQDHVIRVVQPARNLSTQSVQRLDLIRHRAMSVLALLGQENPDLGSRWLSTFGARCSLTVDRRQRVRIQFAPSAAACAVSRTQAYSRLLTPIP